MSGEDFNFPIKSLTEEPPAKHQPQVVGGTVVSSAALPSPPRAPVNHDDETHAGSPIGNVAVGYVDDDHRTPAGNALVADAVSKSLEEDPPAESRHTLQRGDLGQNSSAVKAELSSRPW